MGRKRKGVERTKDWKEKAIGLEAYAPRSRGRPEALQGALFSYFEDLWEHLIVSSWCGSRGKRCRCRNGVPPAVRA